MRHKISVVGSGKDHVNKTINIIPYSLVDALKDEIKKKEFGMVSNCTLFCCSAYKLGYLR